MTARDQRATFQRHSTPGLTAAIPTLAAANERRSSAALAGGSHHRARSAVAWRLHCQPGSRPARSCADAPGLER